MYFLFTSGAFGSNNGVCYSIIDMKLSGQLGSVTSKNIKLVNLSAEKIAVINHANDRDFWITIPAYGSDTIYTFLVTPTGINLNGLKIRTGYNLIGASVGQIKFSLDASKMAFAISNYDSNYNRVLVADFNNTTGSITKLRFIYGFKKPYGLEFSPNSQYIYITDLEARVLYKSTIPNISTYKSLICKTIDSNGNYFGQLLLGPNYRIYAALVSSIYLGVINEPNNYSNCNFDLLGVNLNGKLSYVSLPSFYPQKRQVTTNTVCFGDTSIISINIDTTSIDSTNWFIGDTITPIILGSKITQFKYLSKDTVTKIILAKVYYSFSSLKNFYGSLITKLNPLFHLPPDSSLCIGDSIKLNVTYAGAKYLWQDGTNESFYVVKNTGLHSVVITLNGCIVKDSIQIKDSIYPKVNLPNDTTICEGVPFYLKANSPKTNYLWSNFSTDSVIKITQSGTYWVKAYNACGSSFDTAEIKVEACNCYIYVPNAFTPNGNELNEVFLPVSNCKIINYQLIILNRWGVKIFESNNPNIGWNGKLNEILQSNEVYVYQLQADLIDNFIGTNKKQVNLKGNVTLLN